jgi:hypothetical protein
LALDRELALAADPDVLPELLDAAGLVTDACVDPGSTKATAPLAMTLATPTLAVTPRRRFAARSRAAMAGRTSLCRTLIGCVLLH